VTSVPPEELGRAAGKLLSSKTVMAALLWLISVVVTWAAAKLDTGKDIVALREGVSRLERQQSELVARVDAAVPQLAAQIDGVQRDVVVVGGAALAYETEKRSAEKLRAGDKLAEAYDAQRKRGETPASSALVLRSVAVPHVAR
jgi:hypothetical protein